MNSFLELMTALNQVVAGMTYYLVAATVLDSFCFKMCGYVYKKDDLAKVAFEVASFIKFLSWVPLGLGLIDAPVWLLLALPFYRELYDVLTIFWIRHKSFSDSYRVFLKGHHTFSSMSRAFLSVVILGCVAGPSQHSLASLLLLYYCCSTFLLAPLIVDRLVLGCNKTLLTDFVSRFAFFVGARLSHGMVFSVFGIGLAEVLAHSASKYIFLLLLAVSFLQNEYHSVVSGWPAVMRSYRRIGSIL